MSKRFNLREFQQNLLDRMQVQAGSSNQAAALGFVLGNQNWLVEMSDISEVLAVPDMTNVPLTKKWFCGVANVRGNIYGISDLGAYMNIGPASRDIQSRIMLVGQKYNINSGLLVSKVLGLRNSTDWQRSEQGGRIVYQDNSGQQWYRLELKQLLQQPDFIHIGV